LRMSSITCSYGAAAAAMATTQQPAAAAARSKGEGRTAASIDLTLPLFYSSSLLRQQTPAAGLARRVWVFMAALGGEANGLGRRLL
jgi:hypothetical protein